MGSQPSKRVGSADTRERAQPREKTVKDKVEIFHPTESYSNTDNHESDVLTLSDAKSRIKDLEKELSSSNQQMTEIECQNLDLQDHIQTLEQQIEFNEKQQETKTGTEDFTETLKIKQQYIEKLEKETESVNAEINKLKLKFKKRLRVMKTKFAESKNADSMEVFEIKAEVTRLKEENEELKKLKGKEISKENSVPDTRLNNDAGDSNEETGRMKIILELSAKVSEQDARITELENKLTSKEKHIQRLEKELKESEKVNKHNKQDPVIIPKDAEEYKSTDDRRSSLKQFNKELDVNWYTSKTFHQLSSQTSEPVKNTEGSENIEEEEDDLKSLAAEISRLQMKGKKGKVKKSANKGVYRGVRNASESNRVVDERHSSGQSRDSGFDQHINGSLNRPSGSANSRTSEVSCDSFMTNDLEDMQWKANSDDHGDFERGDIVLSSSEQSDTETVHSHNDSQRTTPIDPSNIRQISALGTKTKRKKSNVLRKKTNTLTSDPHEGSVSLAAKPPMYRVKAAGSNDVDDVDRLLTSIDEDLLLYSKTSQNNAIPVSSS